MLKRTRKLIFLLLLGSVLTGFTAEQTCLFCAKDPISVADCDPEQKDSSKTKKIGENDTFRPEHFPFVAHILAANTNGSKKFPEQSGLFRTLACRTILTPPPERA